MRLLSAGFGHLFLPEVVAVHMKAPPEPNFDIRGHTDEHASLGLRGGEADDTEGRRDRARQTAADRHARRLRLLRRRRPAPYRRSSKAFNAGCGRESPVRPQVSSLYRDNFVSFANPLNFLRSPAKRLADFRHGRDPVRSEEEAEARLKRYGSERSRYYPEQTALLKL